ncbi:serine hydrolase [Spirillospora sp. CA-294931]|uniref:serine hydrolase n=1 Tax=Spirillospora sp. CA-294931 TaxID=3240042 RepID=UPI003D8CED6D
MTLAAGAVTPAAFADGLPILSSDAGPRPAAAGPSICRSSANPRIARRVGVAIQAALRGRRGTESVAVYDRRRGITCGVASARRYDSASVIKATILGATLRRAGEKHRALTRTEKALTHKMITRSDNGAASSLWRSLGRTRMQRFLNLAGMRRTRLGPGGYWGLTQITASDQVRLLGLFTGPNRVLSDKGRAYALALMNRVIPSQRWGTPAGRPGGVRWHVKNGWLPRKGRYWRVHSIGAFGRGYMIVVLTQDTPTMKYGIGTIERVARGVHRELNPDRRSITSESAPGLVPEVSDGSVPPNL